MERAVLKRPVSFSLNLSWGASLEYIGRGGRVYLFQHSTTWSRHLLARGDESLPGILRLWIRYQEYQPDSMKYHCLVETSRYCRDENPPRADSSQLWGLANLEPPEVPIYAKLKTATSKHTRMEGSP